MHVESSPMSRGRTLVAVLVAVLVLLPSRNLTVAQSPEIAGLPEINGWRLAAALIMPRSEQAVAELDGRIYVIGGYPPGRIPSDAVQVYTAAADRWAMGPALPVPMHHTMAASVNGKLYVIGGEFDGAGTGRPEVYLDTVYELDPQAAASWRRRASMPTTRSGGGAAVIDGKMVVCSSSAAKGTPQTRAGCLIRTRPTTHAATRGSGSRRCRRRRMGSSARSL